MKNIAFFLFALLGLASTLAAPAPSPAEGGRSAGKSQKSKKMTRKEKVAAGRSLYMANGCADCHYIESEAPESGCLDGEPLDGIGSRRSRKFVEEHLADPEDHVRKNYKVFSSEPNMMPHPNLTREEVALITDYLFSLPDKSAKKQ